MSNSDAAAYIYKLLLMIHHVSTEYCCFQFSGHDVMKLFDLELLKKGYFTGYDIKTNPTAANAFGTAAFRFGHSLVQHSLVRCDRSHHRLHSSEYTVITCQMTITFSKIYLTLSLQDYQL
jgi:hypothetical protein